MSQPNSLICTNCGRSFPLDTREWRCSCGGLFDLAEWPGLDIGQVDEYQTGLWRYRAFLPLEPHWEPVTLGEGFTPLVRADWSGLELSFKMESQCPTGSFKDRGTAVLATALRGLGIDRVVEDSSGNAGASLAAYATRAGISCEVFVPNTASGPKIAQMEAHGAEVIQIKGKREYAALAAWAAAAHGAYYASHLCNPFFLAGVETIAFEIWEQLGRQPPAALVLPVGNGTLLLGLYRGFRRLCEAGLAGSLPTLVAVQAAACAPLFRAYAAGRDTVEPVAPEATVATAVAIRLPVRGTEILAAVRATGGAILAVTDEQITAAHSRLARLGLYVEETAAAAVAALGEAADALPSVGEGPLVVPLTGHGLKSQGTC